MNHQIISETLERGTLRQSLNLAIIVAAALIFLVPQSAFAQGSGTSILLPMIISGADDTIPDNIPEDIDISDIAQSQGDDDISALNRCAYAGSKVAWSGPVKETYISYHDPGNGVLQYAYALKQEIDYFIYYRCGSYYGTTYYKYRVYGERHGGKICNGYKAFISLPMTCQRAVWKPWQRTSGYGYQGAGSTPMW